MVIYMSTIYKSNRQTESDFNCIKDGTLPEVLGPGVGLGISEEGIIITDGGSLSAHSGGMSR